MRRLFLGIALVVGTVVGWAAPASALDAGIATTSSSFSGNTACDQPPGEFETTLELTGTVTASGRTYVGAVTVEASGSYVQGPCSPGDVFGLVQAFLDEGSIHGSGLGGTVAGACSGGSFVIGPALGLLAIPEPQLRGYLSLGCDVSVNGGAPQRLLLDADVLGPSASQVGVYTAEPL